MEDAPVLSVHTEADFYDLFNQHLNNAEAGDQVSVTCMSLEPAEVQARTMWDKLGRAALAGADVQVALDAYTYMHPRSVGPLSLPVSFNQAASDRRQDAIDQLRQQSGTVAIINQPARPVANLLAGRSHLKIFGVNQQFYVGSPSLHGTDRSELVAGIHDEPTSQYLHQLVSNLVSSRQATVALYNQDQRRRIDDTTELVFDCGTPGVSSILDEAKAMINRAEDWVLYGSPFFPMGSIGQTLKQAFQREVQVHVAHNQARHLNSGVPLHRLLLAAQHLRSFPRHFFQQATPVELPMFHDKVLVTDQETLITSHNLLDIGVRFGTAEIALHKNDPDFARQAARLVWPQISLNQPPVWLE